MPALRKYPDELRERAIRLTLEVSQPVPFGGDPARAGWLRGVKVHRSAHKHGVAVGGCGSSDTGERL